MPRYAEQIAALVRAMIWDRPLEIDPSVLLEQDFWYALRRQQLHHMAAVWALNRKMPIIDAAPRKMMIFHALQRQQRQNALLTELTELMRQHSIEPVLIKGYSLAVLYPNPDMRESGDVDMYIGEAHYDEMIGVMKAQYPDAYWFSEEHAGLHFTMVVDQQIDLAAEMHRVAMEFHSMPRADRAFQAFTLEQMKRTRTLKVGQTDVSIPSKEFDALYVLLHAWHHFESSGVGLRQLADWAIALHQLTADERAAFAPQLEQLLRQMHMLDIWQCFGWVVVNKLGLPREECMLYTDTCSRKGEQLFEQLVKDGHCGREPKLQYGGKTMYYYPYERPETGRLKQKWYTLNRLTFQLCQTRKLFPNYAWHSYLGQFLS